MEHEFLGLRIVHRQPTARLNNQQQQQSATANQKRTWQLETQDEMASQTNDQMLEGMDYARQCSQL